MKQITLTIIMCCLFSVGTAWGNDIKTNSPTAITAEPGEKAYTPYPNRETAVKMLYDKRTDHKYVKTGENSYSEFSQKGKYLKTVASDLPLLVNSSGVHPITSDTFILYKKGGCLDKGYTLLPASQKHPAGCQSVKILVALD